MPAMKAISAAASADTKKPRTPWGERGFLISAKLDVQVFYGLGVRLDEALPRLDFAAHENIEGFIGLGCVLNGDAQH